MTSDKNVSCFFFGNFWPKCAFLRSKSQVFSSEVKKSGSTEKWSDELEITPHWKKVLFFGWKKHSPNYFNFVPFVYMFNTKQRMKFFYFLARFQADIDLKGEKMKILEWILWYLRFRLWYYSEIMSRLVLVICIGIFIFGNSGIKL